MNQFCTITSKCGARGDTQKTQPSYRSELTNNRQWIKHPLATKMEH
jgi:hypothetical protein